MKSGPHDNELFQTAMRGVRRLDTSPKVPPAPRKPAPKARFSHAAILSAPTPAAPILDGSIQAGDELRFTRPGVSPTALRKLRRGEWPPRAELDLHGVRAREAPRILYGFLEHALAREATCVRIIHGKGLRSGATGPVLKQTVDAVLRSHPQVAAFTSAPQADGGTGVAYALLKS